MSCSEFCSQITKADFFTLRKHLIQSKAHIPEAFYFANVRILQIFSFSLFDFPAGIYFGRMLAFG